MGSSRELIVSSSSEQRTQAAKAWLKTFAPDREVLILVPHAIAADQLVHELIAEGGSRFGLMRFTLNRLAALTAAPELARRGAAPAPSLSLSAVVTRAVDGVVKAGEAGSFTPVASRPGFPRALARTFEDLRAACVAFSRLGEVSSVAPLAPFLQAIEAELEGSRLVDPAEVFNIARRTISDAWPWPKVFPVLLLDLPLRDICEHRLLEAVLAHASQVLATVAEGDRTAIDAHVALLGKEPSRLKTEQPVSSLANLQQHLFQESAPTRREADASLSLASWPGEARECVEIARRMQEQAAQGVPFDRMAVFLRAPSQYRVHLEEALRRASIPAWFARGSTRPDPAGRALLALLACAAEGLSARRFAEYLSLAQVPDPGSDLKDTGSPP